jgi:hypothetical protein
MDEHVQAAERRHRLGHQLLALRGLSAVREEQCATPAKRLDLPLGFPGIRIFMAAGDGDVGAVARQSQSGGCANPTGAAGDECCFLMELHR